MPGWAGSDRRGRLPPDWDRRRRRVLMRDGRRCTALSPTTGERCADRATEVDHVKPGDDHSDENLASLCSWHHGKKSAREGAEAAALARRRNARKFVRVESHPGLLR